MNYKINIPESTESINKDDVKVEVKLDKRGDTYIHGYIKRDNKYFEVRIETPCTLDGWGSTLCPKYVRPLNIYERFIKRMTFDQKIEKYKEYVIDTIVFCNNERASIYKKYKNLSDINGVDVK